MLGDVLTVRRMEIKKYVLYDDGWNIVSPVEIKKNIKEKKVIIFGVTPRNKAIYRLVNKKKVEAIFDNDPEKDGTIVDGILVSCPNQCDSDSVVITALRDYKSFIPQLKSLGFDKIYFEMEQDYYMIFQKYYTNFIQGRGLLFPRLQRYHYIHVIPDEKFIWSIFDVIEAAFNMEEHLFIIYNITPNDQYNSWKKYYKLADEFHNICLVDDEINWNAINWNKKLLEINNVLSSCRQIIFHGEWLSKSIREFFSLKTDLLREKGVWIIWSGNVGNNLGNAENIKMVLGYVRGIVVGYDGIYRTLIKNFNLCQHEKIEVGFSYARPVKFLKRKVNKDRYHILIGHSCVDYCQNMETLKMLSKLEYKDKLNIYCITSYGRSDLIDEIEEYGNQNFSNHFFSMRKYMPYQEYANFLEDIDVAVFGLEISAGYNTIDLLLCTGAKVYLKKGTAIYQLYQDMEAEISDYYSILKRDINQFVEFSEIKKTINQKLVIANYDLQNISQRWAALFDFYGQPL